MDVGVKPHRREGEAGEEGSSHGATRGSQQNRSGRRGAREAQAGLVTKEQVGTQRVEACLSVNVQS